MPNCSICGTPYSQWEVRGDIASCPVCDVYDGVSMLDNEVLKSDFDKHNGFVEELRCIRAKAKAEAQRQINDIRRKLDEEKE